MGYSIELYFDQAFETRILKLWEKLDAFGLPSIMQKIGSKPHISLSVLDSIDKNHASELIEDLAIGWSQFEIEFPAIGLIPGNWQTVFLTPIVNSEIIEIQKEVYQGLTFAGFDPRNYYEPGHWLPHCSISKELSSPDALKTVSLCQNSNLTGKAKIVEVGFIEFRPRKEIKKVSLIP